MRYRSAWSCLESAVTDLEMVEVGPNKVLYKTIERIIEEISGSMLLINVDLIEPAERLTK